MPRVQDRELLSISLILTVGPPLVSGIYAFG